MSLSTEVQAFRKYTLEIERISANFRGDAPTVALMLLYVERQLPSCIALRRRLGTSLRCLFSSIDQLWFEVSSRSLTKDELTAMRNEIYDLGSICDVTDAYAALPTAGVALNTCSATEKIIDFIARQREDSFMLCAQGCLEAVREEIYHEKFLELVAAKGSDWLLARRNSIEYENAVEKIRQSAFFDERTQAEISAQLRLAEDILRVRGCDWVAFRKNALPDGVNSLGYRAERGD
jgi:hypothetical protein